MPKTTPESWKTHADSPRGRSESGLYDHVTSAANETVKLLRSLERKKSRAETGLFLAEGARLAEAALDHGWRPAIALASRASLDRPRTLALLERVADAGGRVLTTSERILSSLTHKDNPQTVVCAFSRRLSRLGDFPADGAKRWLALFEVRDPGNLGSILRTADSAGVDGVVLVGSCCDPFSVESVRASMGSLFGVNMAAAGFDELLQWRAATGARIVAASMHGRRRQDQADFGARSIVLMGNEQSGLPRDVEAACDDLVRIPMTGEADSLNLAAATAIMVYEVWRRSDFRGAGA